MHSHYMQGCPRGLSKRAGDGCASGTYPKPAAEPASQGKLRHRLLCSARGRLESRTSVLQFRPSWTDCILAVLNNDEKALITYGKQTANVMRKQGNRADLALAARAYADSCDNLSYILLVPSGGGEDKVCLLRSGHDVKGLPRE